MLAQHLSVLQDYIQSDAKAAPHFYMLNRAEFLQHYHKRSNVETVFHMIKSKFGQRLRSKRGSVQRAVTICAS